MSTAFRVVIADDHPPTRAGVRQALTAGGLDVCAEVGDAQAAVDAAMEHEPDLCLLDVQMPKGGGVWAAGQISGRLPETAVVMLTVSDDDANLFDAVRNGASGYLLKDMDPDRLPNALRGVLAGEAALPRALMARVMEEFRGRGRRRLSLPGRPAARLTPREWDVLERLRDGQTTTEIADELGISPVTVRSHVATILKRLRVKDRAAAVQLLDQG